MFVDPDVIKVKHNTLIDELDLSQVLRVHFNGGEPFMSNDHVAIMKRIVEHNNARQCAISYNTNGTFLPKQEVVDLWKNFKIVKIYFSIDAVDQAFEYIRYPGKWNQILNNFQWWKQLSETCILLEFNVTLGMHNVLYIDDLVNWINNDVKSNYFGDPAHISVQLAEHPSLQIENLPEAKKQQADQQLALLSDYAWAQGARKELQKTSNNNWQQWLNQLDTVRGTSWKNSLSRLL
jgi:molybdenum cofactor biosynthesis enzyme MoaA